MSTPHLRANVIAALSNTGLLRFMTYKENMTAALYPGLFSQQAACGARSILALDHLTAHEAPRTQQRLDKHKGRIAAVPLPKYAPELNAEEYLNNELKGNVKAQGCLQSRAELRTLIQRFMRALLHGPNKEKHFLHPSLQHSTAPGLIPMRASWLPKSNIPT